MSLSARQVGRLPTIGFLGTTTPSVWSAFVAASHALLFAARPLSAVVSILVESRPTGVRHAQHTQARPGPGSHIVRAHSRWRLPQPTRSILQPISDSRQPSPSLPLLKSQKKPLERTRAMQHATATSATLLIPKSRASRARFRVNIADAVQGKR
jgi:hypothetical protein